MEYTVLALVSVILVILLDFALGTQLILNKKFWMFWGVMFILMFIINGYLTWRPIVLYGDRFYLHIRLFTIPVEDFLFGFSLFTSNVIIWEYFTAHKEKKNKTIK